MTSEYRKAYRRQWYRKNEKKERERIRKWRKTHKEKQKEYRKRWLQARKNNKQIGKVQDSIVAKGATRD